MGKVSTSTQEVPSLTRWNDFPMLTQKDYMICYEAGNIVCLPLSPFQHEFVL